MPQRIIAAPKFLALAADRAFDAQIIITAVKLAQFEFEWRVVVWTPDTAAEPVLPHDLMVLFYRPGHGSPLERAIFAPSPISSRTPNCKLGRQAARRGSNFLTRTRVVRRRPAAGVDVQSLRTVP